MAFKKFFATGNILSYILCYFVPFVSSLFQRYLKKIKCFSKMNSLRHQTTGTKRTTTLNPCTECKAKSLELCCQSTCLACFCTRYATFKQFCISYHTHVEYPSTNPGLCYTEIYISPQKTATSKFSRQLFEVALQESQLSVLSEQNNLFWEVKNGSCPRLIKTKGNSPLITWKPRQATFPILKKRSKSCQYTIQQIQKKEGPVTLQHSPNY